MQYFKQSEFKCKCGKCSSDGSEMSKGLLEDLDEARRIAAIPFVIESGYRCKEHNESIGGSPTSSHLTGHAVDISITTSTARSKALDALLLFFGRVGIAKTFIHVDNDPTKTEDVVWVY